MYNWGVDRKLQSIPDRTFKFGVDIIQVVSKLPRNTVGFAISDQLIRSGTSVGANIEEAQNSSTKKEFVHGITIALKEARETYYWLKLLKESGLVPKAALDRIILENLEIVRILTSSVKNAKKRL